MAALSPWHRHFTRPARGPVWATHRLLDAVSRVPHEQCRRDVGLFFRRIRGTMSHRLGRVHHRPLEAAEGEKR
jgi:uncharacterized damage-inducible protein DinB